MTYGLNRALPMTVIGFLLGAGFVILLRALQSMDEIWHAQIGLIVGGVVASIFFLWGIGAFSSRMAAHHVPEPGEDEFGNELPVEDHHHDQEVPSAVLTSTIWTVAFWTMVIFAGLLIFAALPGGFGYTLSADAAANANANGFFPLQWVNGETLFVSKLAAFIAFVAFTMLSLFGMSWLIAKGLFSLNANIKEVKVVGNQPLTPLMSLGSGSSAVAALPSGETVAVEPTPAYTPVKRGPIGGFFHFMWSMLLDEPTPAHRRTTGQRITRLAILFGLMLVLYFVFYEALIGWIMPQTGEMTVPPGIRFGPYMFRIFNSIVSAVLIVLLLLRTRWVLHIIGATARFLARVLRGIPAFLFQRD